MKTVYLLCGVSGSGKSWVADRVSHLVKYVPYDKHGHVEPTSSLELHDRTVHISTTIKRWREKGINVIPLFVMGDLETVKSQLISRGGTVTPNLSTRWSRLSRVADRYAAFVGSSEETLGFLLNELKHRNVPHLVYKATFPNGKIYIGKTNQGLDKRKYDHFWLAKRSKSLMARALVKYQDDISWEIVEDGIVGLELSNEREKYWIAKYGSNDKNRGYNLTDGGDGGVRSEDAEKRRAQAVKKALKNPETRAKLSAKTKQNWEKNRNKMSAAIKKSRSTPESRALTSLRSKETYASPEAKARLSDAIRKRYEDPEQRTKTSKANLTARAKAFSGLDPSGEYVGTWENKKTAAEELGIHYTGISSVLAGRLKHTHGYVFKYVSESINPQTRGGQDEPIQSES